MKLEELITIQKPKFLSKNWRAFVGGIEGQGKNKDEALIDLKSKLENHKDNHLTRTYRATINGTIFCLYYTANTWMYDIVQPDKPHAPSCVALNVKTFQEALDMVDRHVAQENLDYHLNERLSMNTLKRFWVSWYSKYFEEDGCSDPPIQFWISGQDMDDNLSFCAVIDEYHEDMIWTKLRTYFPDLIPRFREAKSLDWTPGDRFPDFENRTRLP